MVYRNEQYFVPKGLTQLLVGDKLLVVSDNNDEMLKKIKDMGIENVMKV
jgi:cell volume regulation protein A